MSKQTKDVYMSAMQQRIFYSCPKDLRVLAARRFGKTDSVLAPRLYRVTQSLPRSTNLWLGSSRKQLMSRTVPGAISALTRFFGLREGVHFGFGKPPKWVPDPIIKPQTWDNTLWFCNGTIWQLISLAVIGSANGMSVTSILADECKFLPKSKIDGEVMPALSGITHPLGDERFSDANPLYKSTCFVSDAALITKGNWLEKEEGRMEEVIESGPMKGKTYAQLQAELTDYANRTMFYNDLLRGAKREGCIPIVESAEKIKEVKDCAQAMLDHSGRFKILPKGGSRITRSMIDAAVEYKLIDPNDAELYYCHKYLITPEQDLDLNMIKDSRAYARHIHQVQANAFCFFRASTLDNLDLLTESYLAQMKRDLPPVVFQISILNKKCVKTNSGFYANLDVDNVHGYIPDDCPAIEGAMKIKSVTEMEGGITKTREYETLDYGMLQDMKNCTLDGDVVDSQTLHIAIDYNSLINWVVTGQVYERDGQQCLNILSSMFVKNGKMLRELVVDWCKYYEPHRKHNDDVFYYYNKTALNKAYAVAGAQDFKDIVIEVMRGNGWNVHPVYMGDTFRHELKYNEINEALAGVAYPAIRFNMENNEALLVAMQNAELRTGGADYHKDKSGEKLSEDADNAVRLEYRTDGTDAFDDLYMGVRHFSHSMAGICLPLRR